MKRMITSLTIVSIFALAAGAVWGAGASLPHGEGFEDFEVNDTLGSDPWDFTNGTASVKSSPETPKDGSSKYVYVSDELDFNINPAYLHSNVWWYSYTKPTLQEEGSSVTVGDNNVAAFYVDASGDVWAYSNTVFVDVGVVDTSDWIGFGVHLDYVNQAYDLYATTNGYSYGDPLKKLNAAPLGFNDNAEAAHTNFLQFRIEGSADFDTLAISKDSTSVGAGAGESPTNSANASEDIYLQEGPSGALVKYFAHGDRTLDGPLGDALFGSLLAGDMIHLKSEGYWYTLTRQSKSSGSWDVAKPGTAPEKTVSDFSLSPTSGMYVEFADGTESSTRQPATVSGFDTTYQATNVVIAEASFNLLSVPMDATKNLSIEDGDPGVGLPDPDAGDILYLKRVGSPGYDFYRCLEDGTWKDLGNNNVTTTLTPGQSFWYYRNGTEDTWDVENGAY